MIDWTRVQQMHQDLGQVEFSNLTELMLDELRPIVEKLRAQPSHPVWESDLHQLKRSAMTLGFRDLAEKCRAVERAMMSKPQGDPEWSPVLDCFDRSVALFDVELPMHVAA